PLSSILNKLKAAEETEQDKRWAYFLFTDLQAPAMVDSLLINNKDVPPHLNIYLAQHPELSNLSIDTCYFLNATIDSRQASQLVVEIKHWGKAAIEKPLRLQLLVNQQVRAIKELTLNNQPLTRDTILLQLSDIGWQQLSVIIEDPA